MKLTGILPVLPTPFLGSGAVDPHGMGALVGFALEAGVDGLVFPGFASEVETLTPDERALLLERVVATAGKRVPVIAGASAPTAEAVVANARRAADLGVRFAMVQPPTGVGSGAGPVGDFMAAVADGLPDMTLILQNAPAPRGADLSPPTILDILRRVPSIGYVKEEALPSGPSISALVAGAPETLCGVIGGGGARYVLDEYGRGAIAAMPALELAPEHVALDRAFRRGDRVEARRLYVVTLPLLVLQAVYRMRLTKHVLAARGVPVGSHVRAPTPVLDAAAIADIDACLAEIEVVTAARRPATVAS